MVIEGWKAGKHCICCWTWVWIHPLPLGNSVTVARHLSTRFLICERKLITSTSWWCRDIVHSMMHTELIAQGQAGRRVSGYNFERKCIFLFFSSNTCLKNWQESCSTFFRLTHWDHFCLHHSFRIVQERLLKLFFSSSSLFFWPAGNVSKCDFCREQHCLTLFLRETFARIFVRRDVCELSGKWMRYFCCYCCRCRFKSPWWQRSELHLQPKHAYCCPEKMGLWGTGLEMTPPLGTLKQICPSVSGICGIVDSSSGKIKISFYLIAGLGAKDSELRPLDLEFWRRRHCPFQGTHARRRHVLTSLIPFFIFHVKNCASLN